MADTPKVDLDRLYNSIRAAYFMRSCYKPCAFYLQPSNITFRTLSLLFATSLGEAHFLPFSDNL